MLENLSKLNIVRTGSYITYSSLKEIGNRILESFRGIIEEYELLHHFTPSLDSVDAHLLTIVLHDEIGGHTLGITDADLKTKDKDEFYKYVNEYYNFTSEHDIFHCIRKCVFVLLP